MEDRLPSIEKLTDSNWPIWKLQITAYLQARELWKLCTGEETEPVLPAGGNDENADGHAELISKYHELQDLTERLAALGAPVDNDFQVALLLRGLP
eukprot:gene14481-15983_t